MRRTSKKVWLVTLLCALICGACFREAAHSAPGASEQRTAHRESPGTQEAPKVEPSPKLHSARRIVSKPDVYGRQRLRFARGRNSATVKGFLGVSEGADYLVSAREGQTLTVSIVPRKTDDDRNNDPSFIIYPPEGSGLGLLNEDRYRWSGKVPQTGEYTIEVRADYASAGYVLTVKIQ